MDLKRKIEVSIVLEMKAKTLSLKVLQKQIFSKVIFMKVIICSVKIRDDIRGLEDLPKSKSKSKQIRIEEKIGE